MHSDLSHVLVCQRPLDTIEISYFYRNLNFEIFATRFNRRIKLIPIKYKNIRK